MFIEQPSPLKTARSSTLLHEATGEDLRQLSNLYRLPWIAQSTDEDTQRAFLQATHYSAKGSPAALFRSLRAIFRGYERELTSATLTPHPQGPTISHPELTDEDEGAWLVWTPDSGAAPQIYHARAAQAGAVLLSPARSSYHQRPPTAGAQQSGALTLLAFTIREPHPATPSEATRQAARPCTVIIHTSADALAVPPTYHREGDTARQPPEPDGGHIMDLFDGDPSTSRGDQALGPYPLYFPSDGTSPLNPLLKELLVAGVRLEIRV